MRERREHLKRVKRSGQSDWAQRLTASEARIRLLGASIVSLALLGFGFYVLLDGGSSSELQKFAAGWIGLVAGYWLK